MFRTALLGAAALAITLPTLAQADSIDDAIKARQGYYQMVKFNAGQLFGMAKGAIDYDAAAAANAAINIQALTNMDAGPMWPMGSSKSDRPGKTRALAEIWTTYPAIGEKSAAFKAAAATLASEAGNGLDALRANVGALGGACKACHDDFRAKDF